VNTGISVVPYVKGVAALVGKGDASTENRYGLLTLRDVTTKAVQRGEGLTIMQPA
jgi:hypothetical protein